MQRAGTAATVASAVAPCHDRRGRTIAATANDARRPSTLRAAPNACYLERALLLWPRLDRSKLRRHADNPARIAEIVERRTSQPFEVILAMLTRQAETPIAPTERTVGFESGAAHSARMAIRIVADDDDEADRRSFVLA